jgi:prepilin-type processing-associated H-X9-DG protein
MNPRVSHQKTAAMTLVEVFVVIIVLAVLAAVVLPPLSVKRPTKPIDCANNVKQISIAYRIWAGDNNGKYPMQVSVTNGGTMELNADGKNAWLNFLVMSNELSTPKVLVCPQDEEHLPPATNFSWQLAGHISYFINSDASDAYPQMFISGDDNFAVGGIPVKSGLLEISTNTTITWTAKRHVNAGNIGLADGSVAMVNNTGLINLLRQTGVATNRLAIP